MARSTYYQQQRVGILVDVQNMYYSAKSIYSKKVNFAAILKEAARSRLVIRAIAYVIRAEIEKEKQFFEALKNIGYEIKAKDLQVFYGGAKKGDWDVGIAMDAIRLASKLDTLVIISGDGDFTDLVEQLQRQYGCRVEIIAFGKSASSRLIAAADDFYDLDANAKKFLIE